ncbi:MAG: excisionase family DNA-binding protein [Chloroflexi bacterium]|nr:excisionase family DNA-binding protein [Chloroflexota bacterium]
MTGPVSRAIASSAALLRLSKSTVYRMIEAGEMPAVRWHRCLRPCRAVSCHPAS